jgi:hypothetical protein
MLENTAGRAEIVRVTTLAADGPGSFAAAVGGGSADVTRIVVFDVSGECRMPVLKGDVHGRVTIARENLWVAGQTAPGPGDGSGRGFTLVGALVVRTGFVVVEHLRIQPIDGAPDADEAKFGEARGLRCFMSPANGSRDGRNTFFCFRNLTIRWTQDVNMGVGGGGSPWRTGRWGYPENVVVDNCLFAEPLNQHMHLDRGSYLGGWNRCLNVTAGAQRVLLRGNLFASGVTRVPQAAQGSSCLVVNNYTFNYGLRHPDSAFRWPMHLNTKNGVRTPYAYEDHEGQDALLVDIAANYAEAGNKTALPGPPWHYVGPHALRMEGREGGLGDLPPNELWDNGDNKVVSYYDPRTAPPNGQPNRFNPRLASRPYYEATTVAPESPWLHLVERPHFPLPAELLPADAVRAHCLAHAGAFPAARDAVDRRIVRQIEARTHSPAARAEPGYRPVAATTAPTSIPYDPGDGVPFRQRHPLLAVDANGLTRLENWLVDQHLAAGGSAETVEVAPRWLARGGAS